MTLPMLEDVPDSGVVILLAVSYRTPLQVSTLGRLL